jgi:phosphatidylglycerol:prolipoprotein diacylglycerol transferase
LFEVGDIAVHTYGIMSAAGFLVIAGIMLRRATAAGIDRNRVLDLVFWTAIAAIVGARGLYILQNPGQLSGIGDYINLRTGGLVFYGALITILPVGAFLIKKYQLPFYEIMDITASAAPLGHALSRLGCLGAGCCYGSPTDLPWGVVYSDPLAPGPKGVHLHPTQLYEFGYLLVIFGIVTWLYPRRAFKGQVALVYLMTYAFLRTGNELLRGDETRGWVLEGLLGPTISTSQGLSLLVAVVALTVFLIGARSARKAA